MPTKPRRRAVAAAALAWLLVSASFVGAAVLDASFGKDGVRVVKPGAYSGEAKALAKQGKKILVAGTSHLSRRSGSTATIARLTRRGRIDRTFARNGFVEIGGGSFADLAVDSRGRIIGALVANSGRWVVRLHPDGQRDRSFGSNGVVRLSESFLGRGGIDLASVGGGKVAVAGAVTKDSGQVIAFTAVRLLPHGHLDQEFGEDGEARAEVPTEPAGQNSLHEEGLVATPSGRLVVAGTRNLPDQRSDIAVAAFSPSGEPDPTFNGDGVATTTLGSHGDAAEIARQGEHIVVAGRAADASGGTAFGLVRYLPNGELDPSFGDGGRAIAGRRAAAWTVATDRKERIIAAGSSFRDGGRPAWTAMRFRQDGDRDPDFANRGVLRLRGLEGTPRAVLPKATRKLYLAGEAPRGKHERHSITVALASTRKHR